MKKVLIDIVIIGSYLDDYFEHCQRMEDIYDLEDSITNKFNLFINI